MWVYFWALSCSLICSPDHPALMPVALQCDPNKVKELESSSSVFLSQDCFDDSGSFVSLYKFKTFFCYSSVKTLVGDLIGIALNLWTALGSILSL